MLGFTMTKDRILFLISAVYLIAFASLYIQLPGLYGPNGLTPVDKLPTDVPKNGREFFKRPNVLRFAPALGISQYDALEVVTVLGALAALLATLFSSMRCGSTFLVLWILYSACFSVGQVFMQFQWDLLLLEAGLLAVLLARADLILFAFPKYVASDRIVVYLMKWLLFRLMFSSGVVKLTSDCPLWWSLDALKAHFQTQCIPTPLAYFAHFFPAWVLRLGVVGTLMIEIFVPLLFCVPLKGVRLFCFYSQVLLQVLITITGNYNFFNLLTIALAYSLLTDDDFCCKLTPIRPKLTSEKSKKEGNKKNKQKEKITESAAKGSTSTSLTILSHLISFLLIVAVVVATVILFRLEIKGNSIEAKTGFSKEQFRSVLNLLVHYAIGVGLLLFVLNVYLALRDAFRQPGALRKMYNVLGVVAVALIGSGLMISSTISFGKITHEQLPNGFKVVHQHLRPLNAVNSYGLFRRMTPNRPEVVLEYAQKESGPWTQLQFKHKAGAETRMPAIIAPHQPRLDWQMWFAALGSAEDNPWLYTLMYRVLNGNAEVTDLLDLPSKASPKFIRAALYQYEFAAPTQKKAWWTSKRLKDYIPPVTVDSAQLKKVLTENKILGSKNPPPSRPSPVLQQLAVMRARVGQPSNLYPLLCVVLVIMMTKRLMFSRAQTTYMTLAMVQSAPSSTLFLQ